MTHLESTEIRYRDRETGELLTEKVFGERELRWFYGGGLGRWLTERVFARGGFNHLYGWLNRSPRSRSKVQAFVDRLGIDASEAALPLDAYPTLDAFFCRRLQPGARPVDPDPEVLVSPADGRALVVPVLGPEGIVVKRSRATLGQLLGDEDLARRYDGGAALIVRLAPADYHRFHFPADGVAGRPVHAGRTLHSVHPIALEGGAPSFRNKRTLTRLETEAFGLLTMIEVGAMIVGTIQQTYRAGPVRRGEEKGTFRFGGSTVVLLSEPGRVVWDEDLIESSREGLESFVKMGSRVGRRGS